MPDAANIIDYATPAEAPSRRLDLEISGDTVRVTFGVAPAWLHKAGICMSFLAAMSQTAMPIFMYWRIRSMFSSSFGTATTQMIEIERSWLFNMGLVIAFSAVTWWPASFYQLYMYRKWGSVPKTIEVSAGKIAVRWLGWWRLRTREWETINVTSVELRTLKNLWPFTTSADLLIRFRNQRRARFRLTSKDPTLPQRIRDALAAAIELESSSPVP